MNKEEKIEYLLDKVISDSISSLDKDELVFLANIKLNEVLTHKNMMKVEVHQKEQSKPIVIEKVKNTYTKGGLYCVMTIECVYKFPTQDIFRIKEFG